MTTVEEAFRILGVPLTASLQDVRSAYRKGAMKFHPDRAPAHESKKAHDNFVALNEAYDRARLYIESGRVEGYRVGGGTTGEPVPPVQPPPPANQRPQGQQTPPPQPPPPQQDPYDFYREFLKNFGIGGGGVAGVASSLFGRGVGGWETNQPGQGTAPAPAPAQEPTLYELDCPVCGRKIMGEVKDGFLLVSKYEYDTDPSHELRKHACEETPKQSGSPVRSASGMSRRSRRRRARGG